MATIYICSAPAMLPGEGHKPAHVRTAVAKAAAVMRQHVPQSVRVKASPAEKDWGDGGRFAEMAELAPGIVIDDDRHAGNTFVVDGAAEAVKILKDMLA